MKWRKFWRRKIGANQFRCELCKSVFGRIRSDEEAMKEQEHVFRNIPDDSGLVLLCEDCHDEFKLRARKAAANPFDPNHEVGKELVAGFDRYDARKAGAA